MLGSQQVRPQFTATSLLTHPQLHLNQRTLIHSPGTALGHPSHIPGSSHAAGVTAAAAAIYQQYARPTYVASSPAAGNLLHQVEFFRYVECLLNMFILFRNVCDVSTEPQQTARVSVLLPDVM